MCDSAQTTWLYGHSLLAMDATSRTMGSGCLVTVRTTSGGRFVTVGYLVAARDEDRAVEIIKRNREDRGRGCRREPRLRRAVGCTWRATG